MCNSDAEVKISCGTVDGLVIMSGENTRSLSEWNVLELMIPPHYQLGSTVVVRPSRFGVVLGLIPGLAILFSSYRMRLELNRPNAKFMGMLSALCNI
jgi:hypothetical protein